MNGRKLGVAAVVLAAAGTVLTQDQADTSGATDNTSQHLPPQEDPGYWDRAGEAVFSGAALTIAVGYNMPDGDYIGLLSDVRNYPSLKEHGWEATVGELVFRCSYYDGGMHAMVSDRGMRLEYANRSRAVYVVTSFESGPSSFRELWWIDDDYVSGVWFNWPDAQVLLHRMLGHDSLSLRIDDFPSMRFDLATMKDELADFDSRCTENGDGGSEAWADHWRDRAEQAAHLFAVERWDYVEFPSTAEQRDSGLFADLGLDREHLRQQVRGLREIYWEAEHEWAVYSDESNAYGRICRECHIPWPFRNPN